ncbi:MAG: hypothetical protein FK730_04980 [Asgard group archaeon]|nr:hypothetical protein [Asgard group archaeon]
MITIKRTKQVFIITLILSTLGVFLVNPNTTEGKVSYDYNLEVEYLNKNIITPNSNGETIGIIVDPALWAIGSTVQNPINQYKKDLEDTGYQVLLHTATIGNVQQIRTFLQNWYSTHGISGATLIGNLPYARFYHPAIATYFPNPETFICDLFLMDLDGNWTDANPSDGVYEEHNNGLGDIYPEIYIGRIDATTRSYGGLTNAQEIVSLLNKIHSYKTGGLSRTHQAITYIDDTWQSWADGTVDDWPAWLDSPYPIRTDVHTPTTLTNGTDWLIRINQDYEWGHLCAHSSANLHQFDPGSLIGTDRTVTSLQINNAVPTFNFYNLFCCHGADWLSSDSLGITYLFSGSHSVGVIGSTKTGGMLECDNFYNVIGQNKTIGQAFHDWFQLIDSPAYLSASAGYYLEWFYGMCILGDPTLTTHYDCTIYEPIISSSTHPDEALWYNNNQPNFNWSVPVDVNGIAGYYYIIDQNPSTIPTTSTGTFTTINGTSASSALTDGIWYLHVVAKDGAGNVGKTADHYKINCDSTNPTVTILAPIESTDYKPGIVEVSWSVTETGSGYDYAEIQLNGIIQDTVNNPTTTYNLEISESGSYTLTVTVYDVSGLSCSDSMTLDIESFFQSMTFYIILGAGGGTIGLVVLVIVIVAIRRRKGV